MKYLYLISMLSFYSFTAQANQPLMDFFFAAAKTGETDVLEEFLSKLKN